MSIIIPLVAADGAKSTVTVADPVVTVAQRGLVTSFNPASDNWHSPILIDGQEFFVENANQAWSLTNPDPYTLRMEVRQGDLWADDATSRSEILTVNNPNNGQPVEYSWTVTVEPTPMNPSMAWMSLHQVHEGTDIPFTIRMMNDIMTVSINIFSAQVQLYADPNPLVRGHDYQMRVQAMFGPTGYLRIWRDGIKIVDYTGVLGSTANSKSLKWGLYQGWPEQVVNPTALRYKNLAIEPYGAVVLPPPPPQGFSNIGETAILTRADDGNAGLICGQKVTLGGQATLKSLSFYVRTVGGRLRLGLYRDANGMPGSKVVEATMFTPVLGWNTQTVPDTVLTPGDYWLVYAPESNTLGFWATPVGGGGQNAIATFAFGPLPSTFPPPSASRVSHWSFYATVFV